MSNLHAATFGYLQATDKQIATMNMVRSMTKQYANYLDASLPAGADKDYVMRKLREVNMWAMLAITRHADGSPRDD